MKKLVKSISKHISQAEDIFKPASPEEIGQRRETFKGTVMEELIKQGVKRSDGRYDFNESVDISSLGLTEIPKNFFGNVRGTFYCGENNLTSLEGSPLSVNGNFDCSDNNLESVQGCPDYVGGDFYCMHNAKFFDKQDVLEYCKVVNDVYVGAYNLWFGLKKHKEKI